MNNWKQELKKQHFYNHSPQNEILKHKPNKTCTRYILTEIKELKNRRDTMFTNWKTQYNKDVNSPQTDPQI